MKVALVQMNVLPGNISKNVQTICEYIKEYDSRNYDIIAFPELCISGYLIGDLWYSPDFLESLFLANITIKNFIEENNIKATVIYGNASNGNLAGLVNEDGRPILFNSAYLLSSNKKTHIVNKTLLPNYRFFDDKRYFSPGESFEVFSVLLRDGSSVVLGLEICEDLWHEDYSINPTSKLISLGAKYIFNLSASPYSYGKSGSRNRVIQRTLNNIKEKKEFKNFFYVNCVGAQNNGKNIVTFDGDSSVYNNEGQYCSQSLEPFTETVLSFDSFDINKKREPANYSKEFLQYQASIVGIRFLDTLKGNTFPYIIGVSGGVDSAVVLALLKEAVGSSRIRAYNLPSIYNSEETKSIAQRVCSSLGIPLYTIPISTMVDTQINVLTQAGILLSDVDKENIQAKIRGTSILSTIAGSLNGVMTNNGNKLEVALGYTTLYGDMNGAISPLGDLLKVEVWAIARYINKIYSKEIIPEELIPTASLDIAVPPSAELKSNQKDPMKWGYHDALLAYLLNYKRGSIRILVNTYISSKQKFLDILSHALPELPNIVDVNTLLQKYGLDTYESFIEDLRWFLKTMNNSIFKRIQAPPIIIQSKSSYGFDIRESQLPFSFDI